MVGTRVLPPAEVAIDTALIADLLRSQHPDLKDLHLGQRHEGWDNVTVRLGEDLAVRLPRRELGAQRAAGEHAVASYLAPHLPCPIPAPVRLGQPERSFPWPWSIVAWVPGLPVSTEPLNEHGAHQLGATLKALHVAAPDNAPRNPHRSSSLLSRMTAFEERLRAVGRMGPDLGWDLDSSAARRIYLRAVKVPRSRPTWAHLDLHALNVLSNEGYLAGVIDWGDAGAGDCATDLGQAMAMVGLQKWESLFAGYGFPTTPTFTRARAEAISFATTLIATGHEALVHEGWRALRDTGVARRSGR